MDYQPRLSCHTAPRAPEPEGDGGEAQEDASSDAEAPEAEAPETPSSDR